MHKIVFYECKRLLCNQFFFGIVLILLFYGWQVLDTATVLGVAHTAPFSAWSFGDYLSRMLPLLWIGALFFLTFFTSSKARRVAILTKVAQINPRRYAAARCAAAFLSTLLLTAVCFVQAALYYGCYFGWYGWGVLLLPALATLFPPLVFAVGSGWLLGQIRPWLTYVWMAVPFLCVLLPLPDALELWNGRFFSHYPLGLGTLDPAFSLPLSAILAQCFLLAAGTALLFFQARKR